MDLKINERHTLLVKYFSKIGLSIAETMALVMEVWDRQATEDMIQYILETRCTEYHQLLETACRISQKYEPDEEMYEDEELEEE